MRNRIRHYRRLKGLTQTDLAESLGTTAATISRLETEGIKVSVDWLEPLAEILQVQMSDLIDEPSPERIEMLGRIGADGTVSDQKIHQSAGFKLHVPAARPVAARLQQALGSYAAGDILIGDRMEDGNLSAALGRDCFVGLKGGKLFLRRLIRGPKSGPRFGLVPIGPQTDVRYVDRVQWCAPIIMSVHYY